MRHPSWEEEAIRDQPPPVLNANDIDDDVRRLLKSTSFSPETKYWLNVDPLVNGVLGSVGSGIPYGKLTELSGLEHGGKTLLATYISGLAQQDGAAIGYMDLENSRDAQWATKLGLDLSRAYCVSPSLTKAKNEPMARLEAAEDLFQKAEVAMELWRQRGFKKQVWLIDSIAMLYTTTALNAGATGQNMRTKADRSQFLSQTLPRWAALMYNYNVMGILINQIRFKVGMSFGDPTYTPGGKAMDHAVSLRARIKRCGYARKNGKPIGLISTIKNTKNKAGDGSVAELDCGFKVLWDRSPAKVTFMEAAEAKELGKKKE